MTSEGKYKIHIGQIKIPEQVIHTCGACPYCMYDSYYTCSEDSGYDCFRADGRRIIDDYEFNENNNKKNLKGDWQKVPIPKWCPFRECNKQKKKVK